MREDDDQVRHFMPLLRRIIILVVVLTAVPVILWTITAFVRSYVGPPKLPAFHQLAATESMEAPESANASPDASDRPPAAAGQARLSDPSSATVEARATTTDARDLSGAPKGPFFGDRAANGDSNAPASTPKVAAMSLAVPADPRTAEMLPATGPLTSEAAAPNTGALAGQRPAASSGPPADTFAAAESLPGPIPLPRQRPRVVPDTRMAQMAQTSVPMPRPRPDAAGPTATPDAPAGPIDWLQNIFH